MALLEVQAVRAGYGSGPDILTDVSIDVEEGRTYCIIGPNGAGKSTLLKTIAGLLKPREGDIVFDGSSIAGRRPDQVLESGVCFVPQDRTIFPGMTVRENLVMGGFLIRDRKLVDERVDEMMERFPRAKKIVITLRGSISASHNTWSGVMWTGERLLTAPTYEITHIVDRVGGGDSFMGGLIYGLLTYPDDDERALRFAVAASCLKHTIYGDFNLVSVDEVEKLMSGDASGRVSR